MLSFLAKLEDGAQAIIGAAITIIFAGMVVVGGLQVFNRFFLNVSLAWSEEFQRYGQAWLVFLAIPFAYAKAHHIGMDFLVQRFPQWSQGALRVTVNLTWAVLGIIMISSGMRIVSLGMVQKSAGMGLSMGTVYSVIVVSGAYITFLAARRLLVQAAAMRTRQG